MKNLLLHICCAPDGSIPVPDLISEGWNVTGFFYGSNIHPLEEYMKRLEAVNILKSHNNIECVACKYNPAEWLKSVEGLENEPEGGERCTRCFKIQLEACADEAVKLGNETVTKNLNKD